jgi:hypothetical protein
MIELGKKKRHSWIETLLLALVVWSGVCNADMLRKLPPEDEASRDPTFVQFRNELLSAVKNREPERFINYIDARVIGGRDIPRGAKPFVDHWRIDDVDSELWAILESILRLGGTFVRSEVGVEFCAPYVFSSFPDDIDRLKHGVVLDQGVRMMSEPSSNSVLVATLDYDIVQVSDWTAVPDVNNTPNLMWNAVTTADGKTGYVNAKSLRSPTEYSACFLQREGRAWKLISLYH